jgi:hypothetical protein
MRMCASLKPGRLNVAARAALVMAFALWGLPDRVGADGGRLRVREETNAFVVSVFTTPETLRAGWADISVLVQDRTNNVALLDAQVDVAVLPVAHPGQAQQIRATHESATNKLFAAGTVSLDTAGAWRVIVTVRRGAERAQVSFDVQVEPAARLSAQWPALSVPPIGVLLFVLHQRLEQRRRTPARTLHN